MLNENLGASHLGVLLWAIFGDILCVLLQNGLEKVVFMSTTVDGLVKVVFMLIAVEGLVIIEFVLICVYGSVIIEFLLICSVGLVKVAL